ncbi:MAG: site-specific integrase, partial [Chlamydiales bacterium]|nr:site-specific integrase [Chlamydiales bacterium]
RNLAEDLIALANSQLMKARREKFLARLEREYPNVSMDEDDVYLFLSNQGGCYYMAKSDPRYSLTRTPPAGQVTEVIKRKLLEKDAGSFPKDFSYHWLRATYAYQMYQKLQILVQKKLILPGDDVSFIQKRMHHESRLTTENYLKLFLMVNERFAAQELWEGKLFSASNDMPKVGAQSEF